MKLERLQIAVLLGLAAVPWYLVLLWQGTPVSWDHLRPFSMVLGFLVCFGILLDRFLWHQPWMHGWFVHRPDLRGTWRVELRSSYEDAGTGDGVPVVICYMGVEQTLTGLNMHLMTAESESWFIASEIRRSKNGTGYQIAGVYRNDPNIELRQDGTSQAHRGAVVLDTHGRPAHPSNLAGEYWTDRGTGGRLELSKRCKAIATRYEDARTLIESDVEE